MSKPNYDTYYAKHHARYYGWLPASLEYKEEFGQEPIKYFTLSAREAIDIFMLELEGVLLRDENGHLPNVAICECSKRAAIDIRTLVRPPYPGAVLVGKLEDILLVQDTQETQNLSPDEDYRDRKLREMMNNKRLSAVMKKLFPFDVINFDPYGSFLDPDLAENKLCRSFEKIFELQESLDTFLLFITTPIHNIHPSFETRLRNSVESNVTTYSEIRDALQVTAGTSVYEEINGNLRTALGFAKAVVASTAGNMGWNCEHQGMYIYENEHRNTMLSSVVRFRKTQPGQDESIYSQDIIRIIQHMPDYCSYEHSLENQEVKDHLERVKEHREQVRNEFRTP